MTAPPPGSRIVVVPAAVHAYFGDPGDGVPADGRETAQARIRQVILDEPTL